MGKFCTLMPLNERKVGVVFGKTITVKQMNADDPNFGSYVDQIHQKTMNEIQRIFDVTI